MHLFARLMKVNEERREVVGRAVQEIVDKVGEIFDYEKSKPHFEEWSKSFAEATDGKSLGNLRAMHGKVAAGKLTGIAFVDAEKAIDITAKVVDDAEWSKVLEGVYTGFSIGGRYVGDKTTEKVDGETVTRYTAAPNEVSLVDNPCVPTAQFFDVLKTDGTLAKIAFKAAAPAGGPGAQGDDPAAAAGSSPAAAAGEPLTVSGTDAEVADFAKALNDHGMSMADAIAAVKAAANAKASPAQPVASAASEPSAAAGAPIDKGMWNVQEFAATLSCIANIAASAESDADWEGDNSPVPEKLRSWLASGVGIFKEMAAEESAELLSTLKEQAGESVVPILEMMAATRGVAALNKRLADPQLTVADALALAKQYGEPLGDDFAKRVLAKATVGDMAKAVQGMHDTIVKWGAACAGKEAAAPSGEVIKLDAVNAELTTLREEVAKLKAQPMPSRVVLRAVPKEGVGNVPPQLMDPNTITLDPADYIRNPIDGTVDYIASRVLKAHKLAQATTP